MMLEPDLMELLLDLGIELESDHDLDMHLLGVGERPERPLLLIVEDNRGVRRLMRRIFEDRYEVHEAKNGREGLEQALTLKPAVVLADQRMPGMTGVELLTRVRQDLPRTVRLLVTGHDDYRPLVEALNAAKVHGYVEKPFHQDDLRTLVDALVRNAELERQRDLLLERLRRAVRVLGASNQALAARESSLERTVDERTRALVDVNRRLRATNRQLQTLAVRDGLTGLFNHRSFMEHLELEVARSTRYKRSFSLLFLDLDDFKQVNDHHGHLTGDAVLERMAELLRDGPLGLRASDLSARYGGEEFCVLLPETDLEGGRIKAERLRQAVDGCDWEAHGLGLSDSVTVSIGVASYPEHGETPTALLQAADTALYEAKRQGKNRVIVGQAPSKAPVVSLADALGA